MSKPLIIDCDTGRDDALTLWLAFRMGLSLRAVVCSYGNTPLSNVVENTGRVLALLPVGRGVPVWAGATAPLKDHPLYHTVVVPRQKASGNGLCNIDLPPTDQKVEHFSPEKRADYVLQLAAREGPVDYVVIGPSTNLAQMLTHFRPEDFQAIGSVTFMAGKLGSMWDENPTPDFNIACDPYALQKIMNTDLPLRFVPMNATWPIAMPLQEIEALNPQNEMAAWAKEIMIAHCRHFAPEPIFRFHDPTVLWAMGACDAWRQTHVTLDCDAQSGSFGRLMENQDGRTIALFDPAPESSPLIRKALLAHLGFDQDV